jgi:hypothetical protein
MDGVFQLGVQLTADDSIVMRRNLGSFDFRASHHGLVIAAHGRQQSRARTTVTALGQYQC